MQSRGVEFSRVAGGLAAACALFAGSGAAAQTVSTLTASLAASDPTTTEDFPDNQPCNPAGYPGTRTYKAVQVNVATSGAYVVNDQSNPLDAVLGVYSGGFDPLALMTNCVAGVDDDLSMTLAAGTYTFVFMNYSPGNFGTATFSFSGPGSLTIGPAPAPVPTLSEWAMILFGTVLAGASALVVHRRRQGA